MLKQPMNVILTASSNKPPRWCPDGHIFDPPTTTLRERVTNRLKGLADGTCVNSAIQIPHDWDGSIELALVWAGLQPAKGHVVWQLEYVWAPLDSEVRQPQAQQKKVQVSYPPKKQVVTAFDLGPTSATSLYVRLMRGHADLRDTYKKEVLLRSLSVGVRQTTYRSAPGV